MRKPECDSGGRALALARERSEDRTRAARVGPCLRERSDRVGADGPGFASARPSVSVRTAPSRAPAACRPTSARATDGVRDAASGYPRRVATVDAACYDRGLFPGRPASRRGGPSITPGQSQPGSERTMSLGLVGRKVGMMRIFTDDGDSIPVTVLDVSNNRVTQIKTVDADGYSAVQLTYGKRRATRVTKPQAGHFAKAGVEAGSIVREFHVAPEALGELKPGAVVQVAIFEAGQKVDVHGTSIGKGFAGTIKRHNFGSGRASHGNSRS